MLGVSTGRGESHFSSSLLAFFLGGCAIQQAEDPLRNVGSPVERGPGQPPFLLLSPPTASPLLRSVPPPPSPPPHPALPPLETPCQAASQSFCSGPLPPAPPIRGSFTWQRPETLMPPPSHWVRRGLLRHGAGGMGSPGVTGTREVAAGGERGGFLQDGPPGFLRPPHAYRNLGG